MVHTGAIIEADPQLNVSFLWDGVVSPELEQIRREVERVAGAMSRDDWRYAPPGKWSCAQILEHLLTRPQPTEPRRPYKRESPWAASLG